MKVRRKKGEGKIKNATKLTANGLEFKSKLEKFTYDKLLEANIKDFQYEEHKFTLIDNFTYNQDSIEMYERTIKGSESKKKVKLFGPITNEIRPMTYLPDFACIKPDKTGWIIEVKGYNNDALNHIKSAFSR